MNKEISFPYTIPFQGLLGGAVREAGPAPLPEADWYEAQEIGDGLAFTFPAGALSGAKYLTADLLLDGERLAVFSLTLQEGENGAAFRLSFGLLNQCQARLRMPLEAVDQNRWRYEREGAWLKPICMGERVELGKVDRISLTVQRKSSQPVRWCMTPLSATLEEPPRLEKPLLTQGKLLDELGQSALHEWQGKTRSVAELTNRLRAQLAAAPSQKLPNLSRAGAAGRKSASRREAFSTPVKSMTAGGWWTRTGTPFGPRGWTACGWTRRRSTAGWKRR